jgi:hypothetical protein
LKAPVIHPGDEKPLARLGWRWSPVGCRPKLVMRESARPSPLISTWCRFRKNRLVVPCQLNRVRVKRRRTSCKNTTVLNHRHTSFFSHIEFVRSRALAGCESSNERKRNGSHSKAPTSWTPEFGGLKVRQTSHEAPSQDGESASPPGTPWIHPGEVSV